MEMCDEGHDPIVHEGHDCPVCHYSKLLDDAKEKVEEVESDLTSKVEAIKEKINENSSVGQSTSDIWVAQRLSELTSAVDELTSVSWD